MMIMARGRASSTRPRWQKRV